MSKKDKKKSTPAPKNISDTKRQDAPENESFLIFSMRSYAKLKFKKKRPTGILAWISAPFRPALFMTVVLTMITAVVLLLILLIGNKYSSQFNLSTSDLFSVYTSLMISTVISIFMAAYIYIALVAQPVSMFLAHRNGHTFQFIGFLCAGVMAYSLGHTFAHEPSVFSWYVAVPAFVFFVWCFYSYKFYNELYELPINNNLSVES